MKVRNGFVSNSSSSSFVVALDPKKTKIKIEIEVDLETYAHKQITTLEEVEEHFKEEDTYGKRDEERYKVFLKAIKEGKTVFVGSFSDDGDDAIGTMLCNRGLEDKDMPKGGVIIESSGGY